MGFAVVYQSSMIQQLSNLQLTGISTNTSTLNTDHGQLYGSFVLAGSLYTLNLYSDITKLDLVATGASSALGTVNLVGQNGSNLAGTVNFIQYVANDTSINVLVYLSQDSDLPMANLQDLSDYDGVNGFAAYHLLAFDYLKEFVITRESSVLYNPSLIDVAQINGGVGGYELSKVLLTCWTSVEMRDASAHYAFYRLAERQAVEDNTFARRAEQSKNTLKAYMESIEIQFDLRNQRVEDKARDLSTWKFGRA
jgi:hypothetical protein